MKLSTVPPALYLRLFFWFSLRHLRRHYIRSLVVLLGTSPGASVFTSVRLAVATPPAIVLRGASQ